MSFLQAIVLGIVQGLGEFLPISSSAHLIIVPWVFGWQDPGLGFDVALHWGTLSGVLIYFWRDLWLLLRGFWHSLFAASRDMSGNVYQKLSWLLILASIPGALIGKLLEDKAETVFRSPPLIALTLAGFGLVMWFADRLAKREKTLEKISWLGSLLIGFSQALAVVPGISRSGSTMSAGLALGLKREDAAKFSFLMSVPIIFGAGILKAKNFFESATASEVIVGFVTAAIFGFLSIKFLMKYLSSHDFQIFVWYRYALAAVVIAVFLLR